MREEKIQYFIYCRKSSEDNRQAASIGDQLRELEELVEEEDLNLAAEPFTEEKSAKEPGRPVFQEMLSRIEDGEANGLLCWDVDRLYRNPADEGRVRWLLQRGVIQEIRTPYRQYHPEDAGLLMGVEGGRAVDHIISLRKGVYRGFRGKLEKGWRPGPAPPGYVNDSHKEQGKRTISPDPERFDLIRRAWDLMLTGEYSVREIQKIAEEDWGLRSPKKEQRGGKPYPVSTWYRIFNMPFYYGKFRFKEPGTDEYRLYDGAHQPMVTKSEYDRVQLLLDKGKDEPSREENLDFAFTGLIRCGECGGMVTAERKYQVRCSECHSKFSALNRDQCRECDTLIDDMEDASHHRYVYYRCSKQRKDRSCSQSSVRKEDLLEQIDQVLARITIPDEVTDWAIRALDEDHARDEEAEETAVNSLRQRKQELERQREHINEMAASPDTDWDLISREELKEQKLDALEELERVKEQLAAREDQNNRTTELSKRTFRFAASARLWLREGGTNQKRDILAALGSNRTLIDKNLELDLRKPFQYLEELNKDLSWGSTGFEPEGSGSINAKTPSSRPEIPVLCRKVNEIRTWWLEHLDQDPPPVFGLDKENTND